MRWSAGEDVHFGRSVIKILDIITAIGGNITEQGGRVLNPPPSAPASLGASSRVFCSQTTQSIRRWSPPNGVTRNKNVNNPSVELALKKARAILNKLTPENFDKLSLDLLNVGVNSVLVVQELVCLIFEKAIHERKFTLLYAQLCSRLCQDAPSFEPDSSKENTTFRRLLLNKCEEEFEKQVLKREKSVDNSDEAAAGGVKPQSSTTVGGQGGCHINGSAETSRNKTSGTLEPDGYHQDQDDLDAIRMRAVGNARFLAELGLTQVLSHSILHQCVKKLLQRKCGGFEFSTNMECLCQLMTICGSALDSAKGQALMDQYFARIQRILEQPNTMLPNRLRFMLEDVVALRHNRWVPKHRGQRARLEEPQKRDNRAVLGQKDETNMTGSKAVPLHLLHMDSDSSSLFRRDSDSGFNFSMPSTSRPTGNSRSARAATSNLDASCFMTSVSRPRVTTETNGLFCSVGTVSGRQRRSNGETGAGSGRRKGTEQSHSPPQQQQQQAAPPPQLMSTSINMDFTGTPASGTAGKQALFTQLGNSSNDNWRGGVAGGSEVDGNSGPPNLPPRLQRKVQQLERRWETVGLANGISTNTGPTTARHVPVSSANSGSSTVEGGRRQIGCNSGSRSSHPGPGISLYPGGSRQAGSLSNLPNRSNGRGQLPPNLFEPAYLQRPGSGLSVMISNKGKPSIGGTKDHFISKAGRKDAEKVDKGRRTNATGEGWANEDSKAKLEELLNQCFGVDSGLDRSVCVSTIVKSKLLPLCGAQFVDGWIGRLLQGVDHAYLAVNLRQLADLRADSLLTADHIHQGLSLLTARLGELETTGGGRCVGLKSKLARVLAILLILAEVEGCGELLSFRSLCEMLTGGTHHPLFLLCLQHAMKGRGMVSEEEEDEAGPLWLLGLVEKSEVQLEKMLPASSRQKGEHVWEVFEERGLSFLLPRVKLSRHLCQVLSDSVVEGNVNDDDEESLDAWLELNFPTRLLNSKSMVKALYAAVTERIWRLSEQQNCTGRELMMLERKWWRRVAESLKKQVSETENDKMLEVEAVHALQLVWHEIEQPKDFLLRCFMNLYELEVLEEDAFLAWREEVNPAYPDKGRALFQVNQWLTWLEEAEEEDSADEDG